MYRRSYKGKSGACGFQLLMKSTQNGSATGLKATPLAGGQMIGAVVYEASMRREK